MRGRFFWRLIGLPLSGVALVGLALLFGTPVVMRMWNAAEGPYTATATHRDGSVTFIEQGQDLPLPAWIRLPPDARIVQGTRMQKVGGGPANQSVDFYTRAGAAETRAFFATALRDDGFAVTDLGNGPGIDEATADMLGIDGQMQGTRATDGAYVLVSLSRAEGWIWPVRLVEVGWKFTGK